MEISYLDIVDRFLCYLARVGKIWYNERVILAQQTSLPARSAGARVAFALTKGVS